MKMSSPLNSTLPAPSVGVVRLNFASAETKKVPVIVMKTLQRYLSVTPTLLTVFALVTAQTTTAHAAGADHFELGMVIKETPNPSYNATLSGARIAAGEIGGTANNYG